MVTRILDYELDIASGAIDSEADSKSPRDGQMWEVQEIYNDQVSNLELSLVLNERKLFDNIPAPDLADENNGLPVNITVTQGDDLDVLMSDPGGNNPGEAHVYVVVDEMSA